MIELKFAKKHKDTKIPSKREGDAGYDIYPAFDEDYIVFQPLETKMIPTGLYSAFGKEWQMIVKERGSTGTKGMAQRCGVIDSNYRGEWFIPITNSSDSILFITKLSNQDTAVKYLEDIELPHNVDREDCVEEWGYVVDDLIQYSTFYPYTKAIAQAVLLPVPATQVEEISLDILLTMSTERGDGMLGSSGK